MHSDTFYYFSNQITTYNKDKAFVVLYDFDKDPITPPSSIVMFSFADNGSITKETVFECDDMISSITITPAGNLWAVDIMGNAHMAQNSIDNKPEDLEWLTENITLSLKCVGGANGDIWMSDDVDEMFNYADGDFFSFDGVHGPTRFKEIKNSLYLLGSNKNIMCLDHYPFERLSVDKLERDIDIDDITLMDDTLYAVSKSGLIFRQSEVDEVFYRLKGIPPLQWGGVDVHDDRMYLSAADSGAYVYSNGKLEKIKGIDRALGVSVLNDNTVLFYNSKSSHPRNELIVYNPLLNENKVIEF